MADPDDHEKQVRVRQRRVRLDAGMADTREALKKIRSTFDTLDEHRDHWASPETAAPAVGSALAVHDEVWSHMPLSQLARAGLACAWDHFDLVRLTIEQERGFPTATYSVVRGALLASCQVLWAIGPDDPAIRRERGLILTWEYYRRRIQWQDSFSERRGAVYLPAEGLDADDAARIAEQSELLLSHRDRVRALLGYTPRLHATDCVTEAAGRATDRTGVEALRGSTHREWMRLGGDAHGLGWPLMTQTATWGRTGGDGLTETVVTVNLVTLANGYLCAWLIYRTTFERLQELSAVVGAS